MSFHRIRRLLNGTRPVFRSHPGFVVIDVETTGLDATTERMIECALVTLGPDGSVLEEWSTLIDIPGTGALGAEEIHGISRSMLSGAPTFADLVPDLCARLRGRIVVGHVVRFDLEHLAAEFNRAGTTLPELSGGGICTRDLARRTLPPGPKSLEQCCFQCEIGFSGAHSALGDARATAELLVVLLRQGSKISRATWRSARSVEWPVTGPLAATTSSRSIAPMVQVA